MQHFVNALWQGILSGAAVRDRASAPKPESKGYSSGLAQGLYWLGFEVANVVVHGPRSA